MTEMPSWRIVNSGSISTQVNALEANIQMARPDPPNDVARLKPPWWTNQDAPLRRLIAHLSQGKPGPVLLRAEAGSGSTTLLGAAAAETWERYSEGGQARIVLRPDLDPSAALREFLESRDIAAPVPGDTESAQRLLRRALGSKPVLLVVEGVRTILEAEYFDTELPNVVYVVVSSTLKEWAKAETFDIPLLTKDDAIRLMRKATSLSNSDIELLVDTFEGRPKALLLTGKLLDHRAGRDVTARKLVQMAGDGEEGRLILEAMNNLSPEALHLYRALSVFGSNPIEPPLIEMLATTGDRRESLEELRAKKLLEERVLDEKRRGPHYLVVGGKELRFSDASEPVRSELRLLLGWMLRRAQLADEAAMVVERTRVGAAEPVECPGFTVQEEGRRWFAANHRTLLRLLEAAYLQQWWREVWSIADALWGYYSSASHHEEAERCYELAAKAARGEPRAEARMRQLLGKTLTMKRDWKRAKAELERSLDLAEETGNPVLIGSSIELTGRLLHKQGAVEEATLRYRRAEELARQVGDERTIGLQLRFLGEAYRDLGEPHRAGDYFARAQQSFDNVGDVRSTVIVEIEIALLQFQLGAPDAAGRLERAIGWAGQIELVRYADEGRRRYDRLRGR